MKLVSSFCCSLVACSVSGSSSGSGCGTVFPFFSWVPLERGISALTLSTMLEAESFSSSESKSVSSGSSMNSVCSSIVGSGSSSCATGGSCSILAKQYGQASYSFGFARERTVNVIGSISL